MNKIKQPTISVFRLIFCAVCHAQEKNGPVIATGYASAVSAALLNPAVFALIRSGAGSHPVQTGVTQIDKEIFAFSFFLSLIASALTLWLTGRSGQTCMSQAAQIGKAGRGKVGVFAVFFSLCIGLTVLGETAPMWCVALTTLCLFPLIRPRD